MKKSSSSKKKQNRSSATRLDSSFARAPLSAKVFFLALGIMGGALVAAGVKTLIVNSGNSEIELSETIESSRPTTSLTRSSKSRPNRVANTPKSIAKPKLTLAPEPVVDIEQVADIEAPKVVPLIKEKTKEKNYTAAPKRRAIAIIASVPQPLPKPAAAHSIAAVQTPAAVPASRPKVAPAVIPTSVKPVAMKKVEERPIIEEISSLSISEEPRAEASVTMKDKPKKVETQEKIVKDAPKLASHIAKDENFRSRLKKVKKVEVVEVDAEEIDTATSPFQDRLRKSVK